MDLDHENSSYVFKVELRLGNAAMQTADDVAEQLRTVADKLHARGDFGGSIQGPWRLFDENGAHVGEFELVER